MDSFPSQDLVLLIDEHDSDVWAVVRVYGNTGRYTHLYQYSKDLLKKFDLLQV